MIETAPTVNRAIVLYDGDCAFCRRSVRILQSLDWLGQLAFQSARNTDTLPQTSPPLDPQKLIEEMHVVPAGRDRSLAGFSAFRWIAWRLPITAWFAPLLYIPGVLWIGNRVYRWVARNRFDLIPCHDGACQIPLKKS